MTTPVVNICPAAFDMVVPLHKKDTPVFYTYTLPHLLKNAIGLQTLYIVCSPDAQRDLSGVRNVEYFNEKKITSFSFDEVKQFMKGTSRAGWYYQQLLKLYAHRYIRNLMEYYVIWDSDTVLLKPTAFFHNDYGEIRGLYAISPERNPPYLEHMERLLPGLKRISNTWGGVTHHQPWTKKVLKDLFERVEFRHGNVFWKGYLACVEQKHYGGSGCADYEIVMAFAGRFHTETMEIRPLRWANRRELPSPSEDLDFVSLHEHMMPLVPKTTV
jgi:hypothetical protein